MFIPYSTDLHEGKIGIASLTIIVICVIMHLFISLHDKRLYPELNEAAVELQMFDTTMFESNKVRLQLLAEMAEQPFDVFIKSQTDAIKSKISEITEQMWLFKLGYKPSEKKYLNIITSMFVHIGWMHLIGNLLFFYVCAVALERFWGSYRFTLFYLLSGVGAAMFYLLYGYLFINNTEWQTINCVGASGAISGTIGALLVKYPKNKVSILWWFFRRAGTFRMPIYAFFGFWTLEQIFYILIDPQMNSGTAFSAHLGGLVTGLLFGLFLKSDETVFDTVEKNSGSQKKFVMLDANGAQAEINKAEGRGSISPQKSLVEQGFDSLNNGNSNDASLKLSAGIDQLFLNAAENRVEIDTVMKQFFPVSEQLHIDGNIVYQWGKKLYNVNLPILAIQCFDLASKSTQNRHLLLNSILAASKIRVEQQYQIEYAIKTLHYITSNFPQELQALEAQKILEMFNK